MKRHPYVACDLLLLGIKSSANAFCSPSLRISPVPRTFFATPEDDPDTEGNAVRTIADRFLSPRVDDIGLPLADALVAQIVAPSFQVFSIAITRAPLPTWLQPATSQLFWFKGALLVPTLIHGAGLACCWTLGALAAEAYAREAWDVSDDKGYGTVISRTLKAGAFATGVLIIATQIDLLSQMGGYVQLGYSQATDIRLLTAGDELLRDIFFEATTLFLWRIYRASRSASGEGQS